MRDGCSFCDYDGPSEIIERYLYSGCFVIEPINPVTEGHVLVIPEAHIESVVAATTALERLAVADVFRCAISYAQERVAGDFNLITSVGEAATQTVKHLHAHVVPRREGDGLLLPWSVSTGDEKISQWTCPTDGCDYVHEMQVQVARALLGATPTPKCPRHEVPMLLAGWR